MTVNPYASPAIAADVTAGQRPHRRGARVTFVVVAFSFLLLAASLGFVAHQSTDRALQDRLALALVLINFPGIVPMAPLRLTLLRNLQDWPEWTKHTIRLTTFACSAVVWGWLGSLIYVFIAKRRAIRFSAGPNQRPR